MYGKVKRSVHVYPRRLLKNVNISTGAKNSGQKDFEIMLGKEKKMAKSYGHSMGETCQLSFPKLTKCIYFFSDGGKLTSLMHCSS